MQLTGAQNRNRMFERTGRGYRIRVSGRRNFKCI